MNQSNIDKKCLAVELITELKELLGDKFKPKTPYKLKKLQTKLEKRPKEV